MLLIIDFYEKMAVSSKRREQMNKVRVNMKQADMQIVIGNEMAKNFRNLENSL